MSPHLNPLIVTRAVRFRRRLAPSSHQTLATAGRALLFCSCGKTGRPGTGRRVRSGAISRSDGHERRHRPVRRCQPTRPFREPAKPGEQPTAAPRGAPRSSRMNGEPHTARRQRANRTRLSRRREPGLRPLDSSPASERSRLRSASDQRGQDTTLLVSSGPPGNSCRHGQVRGVHGTLGARHRHCRFWETDMHNLNSCRVVGRLCVCT